MEFFSFSDFEYFSRVRGTKIRKGKPDSSAIGLYLTEESVYAKTNYWAEQLKRFGFNVEMSWHWQNSGNIRTYTWAKIYLPGDQNTRIFFTVGVGSRFTVDHERVNTLEYKLDCQRKSDTKGLSEAQVKQFDNYIQANCPEAERNIIDLADLINYDWDILVNETHNFVNQHLDNYRSLISIVWPYGVNIEQKTARLCWNNYKWQKPSGENGKSKSSAEPFEQEKGYGYEEWLFDTEKQIDGYHYGFIQAFHKGEHKGKVYDIMLYSIYYDIENRTSSYYWIGDIKEAIVLNPVEQVEIFDTYQSNGWLDKMLRQLNDIGIAQFNVDYIDPNNTFNVKFKVADNKYVRLEEPQLIENPNAEIGKNTHYVLLSRLDNSKVDLNTSGKYKFRAGHNPTQTGTVNATWAKQKYTKSLKHKKIQENIYNQLYTELDGTGKEVGTEVVTGYGTLIDLVVSCPNDGDTFYEIKTNGTALKCIREALGQLFEYHFYPGHKNANKLIIIAPYPAQQTIKDYIKHLRQSSGIEIYYQYYSYELGKLVGVAV